MLEAENNSVDVEELNLAIEEVPDGTRFSVVGYSSLVVSNPVPGEADYSPVNYFEADPFSDVNGSLVIDHETGETEELHLYGCSIEDASCNWTQLEQASSPVIYEEASFDYDLYGVFVPEQVVETVEPDDDGDSGGGGGDGGSVEMFDVNPEEGENSSSTNESEPSTGNETGASETRDENRSDEGIEDVELGLPEDPSPGEEVVVTARSEEGEPVGGADVYVEGSLRGETGENGAYSFRPNSTGEYLVVVDGPETESATLEVEGNNAITGQFFQSGTGAIGGLFSGVASFIGGLLPF